jgi:glycosyltransferase involved in cell wall biosynthesis
MSGISIIIPAHNNADVLLRTLLSVEQSANYLRENSSKFRDLPVETIVVDDGSNDGTAVVAEEFAQGRDGFRLIRRDSSSSAGCARNTGAAMARGDVLFFLDADDIFMETHLLRCCDALEDPAVTYVKTRVLLDAPVHEGWHRRIEYSTVINLGIRRKAHEFFGGFLDLHIFRRSGDLFLHHFNAFESEEDVYYNHTIRAFYTGVLLSEPTVRYIRRPGNNFDRQYEKFRHAPGEFEEQYTDQKEFQIKLCELLFGYHAKCLKLKREKLSDQHGETD